jgi:hypothetical protein
MNRSRSSQAGVERMAFGTTFKVFASSSFFRQFSFIITKRPKTG